MSFSMRLRNVCPFDAARQACVATQPIATGPRASMRCAHACNAWYERAIASSLSLPCARGPRPTHDTREAVDDAQAAVVVSSRDQHAAVVCAQIERCIERRARSRALARAASRRLRPPILVHRKPFRWGSSRHPGNCLFGTSLAKSHAEHSLNHVFPRASVAKRRHQNTHIRVDGSNPCGARYGSIPYRGESND